MNKTSTEVQQDIVNLIQTNINSGKNAFENIWTVVDDFEFEWHLPQRHIAGDGDFNTISSAIKTMDMDRHYYYIRDNVKIIGDVEIPEFITSGDSLDDSTPVFVVAHTPYDYSFERSGVVEMTFVDFCRFNFAFGFLNEADALSAATVFGVGSI